MTALQSIYESKLDDNSDICQHLPTLKKYAEKSDHIVELGVRSIRSTWAFLMGKPKTLISVDIHHPSHYLYYDTDGCDLDLVFKIAKEENVKYAFIEADTTEIALPTCNLIFFDTLHTYEHLSKELYLHANKSYNYLIFHDTVTCGDEIMPAIYQFMEYNEHWVKHEEFFNNNGLLILKRI